MVGDNGSAPEDGPDCDVAFLFPGQEADAVSGMRQMLVDPPEAPSGDRNGQSSGRRPERRAASGAANGTRKVATDCEGEGERNAQKKTPKPLRVADLGDGVRSQARVGPEGFEPPTKGL